jgi:hypothetical protein
MPHRISSTGSLYGCLRFIPQDKKIGMKRIHQFCQPVAKQKMIASVHAVAVTTAKFR